jgi:DNA-binding MarR family transcriptional regulator
MTPTPAELLALRHRVSDSVLLDWLDLEQLLPERPCHIETEVLRRHWCCSQPTVSRRITRLWEAGLLDFRSGGGLYRIRRLGRM